MQNDILNYLLFLLTGKSRINKLHKTKLWLRFLRHMQIIQQTRYWPPARQETKELQLDSTGTPFPSSGL